jgi:hypothetical protein
MPSLPLIARLVVASPLVAPSSCPLVILSLPTSPAAPATMVVVVPRRPRRQTLSSGWTLPSQHHCRHHCPGCCFLPSNLVAVAIALAAVANASFIACHPRPPLSPLPSPSPSLLPLPSLALPPSCRRRRAVALPPPPLMLPPPPHRRQATPCCHAAALLPPLRRCRAAVCWLVVALLSAIRFRHHMPSCNHQCSCCRLLLPINCRQRMGDDLLVDKAGTKTCCYSSGGALVASHHLPLQRFAMVDCLHSLLSRSSSSTTSR